MNAVGIICFNEIRVAKPKNKFQRLWYNGYRFERDLNLYSDKDVEHCYMLPQGGFFFFLLKKSIRQVRLSVFIII